MPCRLLWEHWEFLSTPSARRATENMPKDIMTMHDFYPRPPRGGRRAQSDIRRLRSRFLSTPSARRATLSSEIDHIHRALFLSTPSARRATPCGRSPTTHTPPFLSTPSARRATQIVRGLGAPLVISIHALREEGDARTFRWMTEEMDFYPRPPRGGRLRTWVYCGFASGISIHALREEGDRPDTPGLKQYGISIHALREEGDGQTS